MSTDEGYETDPKAWGHIRTNPLQAARNNTAEGLATARDYAAWHIGDPDWADAIINAYFNPAEAQKALRNEKADGNR